MLTETFKSITMTQAEAKKAFELHMRASYRQAYGLAQRLTNNSAEAEDLVQETYIRAYRFFNKYDRSLAFTSWLYRIMTNVHIDSVRKSRRLRTTSLDGGVDRTGTWEVADDGASPEKPLIDRALEEPISLALRSMTPDFRVAVLLADVEGLDYEEIAQVMQISIGTVRSRIHRGRRQIREYLENACPGKYAQGELA